MVSSQPNSTVSSQPSSTVSLYHPAVSSHRSPALPLHSTISLKAGCLARAEKWMEMMEMIPTQHLKLHSSQGMKQTLT
ncbi:uncharacterized protein LOC135339689 isoform X2 [Halichondria panicea]|uniref:uncharacterized protein LOC135339689 isoform X2 n=1 Tax=Halichondria panicea TaxID=6063 RepID=UPI00312BAAAF